MSACSCGANGCSCSFELAQDSSIVFQGEGTVENPYRMSALNPGYARPFGRSSSSVTQTGIATSVDTAVIMNTEDYDNNNMIDIGGFPTRVTIQLEGYYLIGGQVNYQATAGPTIPAYLKVRRNGSIIESIDSYSDTSFGPNVNIYLTSTCCVSCSVGDYFEIVVNTNSSPGTYGIQFMNLWALRLGDR
jgi:hypothetical protein